MARMRPRIRQGRIGTKHANPATAQQLGLYNGAHHRPSQPAHRHSLRGATGQAFWQLPLQAADARSGWSQPLWLDRCVVNPHRLTNHGTTALWHHRHALFSHVDHLLRVVWMVTTALARSMCGKPAPIDQPWHHGAMAPQSRFVLTCRSLTAGGLDGHIRSRYTGVWSHIMVQTNHGTTAPWHHSRVLFSHVERVSVAPTVTTGPSSF